MYSPRDFRFISPGARGSRPDVSARDVHDPEKAPLLLYAGHFETAVFHAVGLSDFVFYSWTGLSLAFSLLILLHRIFKRFQGEGIPFGKLSRTHEGHRFS